MPTSSFFYDVSLDTTERPMTWFHPPYTLYIRNSQIASVATITVTSPTPGSVPEVLTEGTDYVVRRYGVDIYRTFANDSIEIEYSAGLAGSQIKIFRLLILRAASREMQNMHDDVVGIKDLETRNTAPLTTGFSEEELRSVKSWKRVRIS